MDFVDPLATIDARKKNTYVGICGSSSRAASSRNVGFDGLQQKAKTSFGFRAAMASFARTVALMVVLLGAPATAVSAGALNEGCYSAEVAFGSVSSGCAFLCNGSAPFYLLAEGPAGMRVHVTCGGGLDVSCVVASPAITPGGCAEDFTGIAGATGPGWCAVEVQGPAPYVAGCGNPFWLPVVQ